MTDAVGIQLSRVAIQYQTSENKTLSSVNMVMPAGKWTSILGKSGCGKTTMLRALAGLLEPGTVFHGDVLTSDGIPLSDRVAYMAQQDLLYPWLNVMENICLSQRFGGKSADYDRARMLLKAVGLDEVAESYPEQLSGGMRQRVALARTLMQDKPVVLMDEPFSAVDAVTRYQLQDLAVRLLKGKTILLVTHDPQEAARLADAIYIFQGSPAYASPLAVPMSQTPRDIDVDAISLQQTILSMLGAKGGQYAGL
ncbi:ABC transporter ATP-binding protein [Veronia pacifica]|uniref:Hydrogenase expression protein n=1 Tax=Veronia pacifica TaxID=1080227 RepID=A0A1C3ERJ5_9GAMM|nr:ABC transporter ATP-binding protein [Veronia pacifica]ODA35869.1 hydrogenase expression protein [Veronia pacifica]